MGEARAWERPGRKDDQPAAPQESFPKLSGLSFQDLTIFTGRKFF